MGKQKGSEKGRKTKKQNYESIEDNVREVKVKLCRVEVNI